VGYGILRIVIILLCCGHFLAGKTRSVWLEILVTMLRESPIPWRVTLRWLRAQAGIRSLSEVTVGDALYLKMEPGGSGERTRSHRSSTAIAHVREV